MKNKKVIIIFSILILLILVGVVLILTGNNKSFMEEEKGKPGYENEDNNVVDDTKPVVRVFTKNDVMSIIYEQKAISNDEEDWYVGDTALLAHNSDNTSYLVRYKKVLGTGSTVEYESIVSIDENGKRSIDIPGWTVDSKNINIYQFIYYTEGSEDYDPINQQYNPELNLGWEQSENDWNNYEYVPDNSWQ